MIRFWYELNAYTPLCMHPSSLCSKMKKFSDFVRQKVIKCFVRHDSFMMAAKAVCPHRSDILIKIFGWKSLDCQPRVMRFRSESVFYSYIRFYGAQDDVSYFIIWWPFKTIGSGDLFQSRFIADSLVFLNVLAHESDLVMFIKR